MYAEVFSTVHYFQYMSVESVDGLSLKAFIEVDSDDLTLLWMSVTSPPILLEHLDPLAVFGHHHLF